MLFYGAALDLSRSARTFVADLIRGHRYRVGSRWRRLPPGHQAPLVLVHLRRNETFARPAAAFAADRLHYSGKHRRHGVNVQFLTDPHGELIWARRPAGVHS
ncbi:hypothetical protein [Actinomadura chokoriensis]|uniref:hypothetical protein n=1 Tax=Actinomadura chokoriensis TaxID=454156 RepID=UPI0031F9755C